MILICTDGFCWLPICIAAILSYLGYNLPDYVYIFTACILLPINSAANPIIYSKYGSDLASKSIQITKRALRKAVRNHMETDQDADKREVVILKYKRDR